MTDTSEPPQVGEPPPPPPAAPTTPAPQGLARMPPVLLIAAVLAVVVVLAIAAFAVRGFSGAPAEETYAVEPFTPETEIITAREGVIARAEPDDASAAVVMFGQGVTLNVNGRVARGLGGDWYAIAWNERTAYVRQQDAVAGSGAPPTPDVREKTPEEEIEEEEEKDKDPFAEEEFPDVAEAAPSPGYGLGIGDVNWIREPNARDFARYFPDRALDDGQSGNVTLDCMIGGNGRLNCSIVNESPSGYGFGRAAMNISRQVRVDPTLPDGSSAAGRRLQLPLSFRAG